MTTEHEAAIERVKRYQSEPQHDDAAMDYGEDRYITDLEALASAHIAHLEAEAQRKRERYEWTREAPTKAGMHWMTYAGEDWDIALRMVRIRHVEDAQGVRTEIQVGFTWTDTRDDMFREALWCGPMPNPGAPSLDLLAALKGEA